MAEIDKRKKRIPFQILITISFIAIATGLGWGFRQLSFPETNIVVAYILSVLLVARSQMDTSMVLRVVFSRLPPLILLYLAILWADRHRTELRNL
jgi:K+-sensing histidine kinase KdpD